jgi:tRNA(Ile)-lysidine synthase
LDEIIAFMAAAQSGRSMRLPRGLGLERTYDRFFISEQGGVEAFSHALKVFGVTAVPELDLAVETSVSGSLLDETEKIGNYRWQAMLDYDKITPCLTIRSRRPGDRFCPSGMNGRHKKLQDFLVNEKVTRRDRDRTPLLCSGDDIVWVVGLRTDERFLPGRETRWFLTVTVNDKIVPR